jgi:muconolactone delta-isomerase
MTKSQAKKIAYRRAWLILQSTMEAGWSPNNNMPYRNYSIFDAKKILDAMEDIISQLWRKSRGNLENIPRPSDRG